MTIAERVEQYEGDLGKLRTQQAEIEVHVRRVEGAILALRQIIEEEAQAGNVVDGDAGVSAEA